MRASELLQRLVRASRNTPTALQDARSFDLIELFCKNIQEKLESGQHVAMFDFLWFSCFSPERSDYLQKHFDLIQDETEVDFPEQTFWQWVQYLTVSGTERPSDLEDQFGAYLTRLDFDLRDQFVYVRARQ